MIYTWYAIHLGALILRNFGEFVNTVAMPETPMFVQMLSLGLLCAFAVWSGVEVMARISAYLLPLIIFIIATIQVLGTSAYHLNYLKPILGNGFQTILQSGFVTFAFPFAETVLFLSVFSAQEPKKSPYKVYYGGILLAGFMIILINVTNTLVLGVQLESIYFPSHVAVSRISIGDFLQRMEVTASIVFVVGVFIKTSICLLVACKGIAKIFNLADYRSLVTQTGLLMVYLAYLIYDNIMLMRYWAIKVYPYYAFPFQVILPVLILLAFIIKKQLMPR